MLLLSVVSCFCHSCLHLDEGCLLLVFAVLLLSVRVPAAAAAVAELLHGLGRGPESHLVTLQVQVAPLPEPLLVKVQGWGMQLDRMVSVSIPKAELFANCYSTYLVEQHVERPWQEEADPSDGHHDPHLGRGQLVRDPVDVNQLHVGLDAQLCGDGQPGKVNSE